MTLVICIVISAGMAVLATDLIPSGWRVPGTDWAVIVPLAYVVCRVFLNFALTSSFFSDLLLDAMHCGR